MAEVTLAEHLAWEAAPAYAAGLAHVALAAWVYGLAPRAAVHRAFALYLFIIGSTDVAFAFKITASVPTTTDAFQAVERFGMILATLPLLWFLLEYPGPRLTTRTRTRLLALATTVVLGAVVLRMSLPGSLGGEAWLEAAPAWAHPLGLLWDASMAAIGIAAFVLAGDLKRTQSPQKHRSLQLVVLGFLSFPLYRGTVAALDLPDEPLILARVGKLLLVAGAIVALAAAWRLARDSHGRSGPPFGLVVFLAAVVLLGVARALGWLPLGVTLGTVEFVLPLLVSYALVRHQLFGIDLKVKWTLKQSTVAAVFVGLFFVVSESAAAFFSDTVGTYLGIVAAGALVFAIAPLQHFAQRVADRAMPGVKAVGEMSEDERARLYIEQVRGAWADGTLSRDEREMLERLRSGLGISVEDAHRLERHATGEADA